MLRDGLKAESSLHFDGTSSQSVLGLAKVCIHDVILYVHEVQLVKQVVEVGTEFESRVLAQNFRIGQPERLAQSRIYVDVSRTVERIALDSRRCGDWAITLLTGGTERGIRVGEQAIEQRTGDDCGRRK